MYVLFKSFSLQIDIQFTVLDLPMAIVYIFSVLFTLSWEYSVSVVIYVFMNLDIMGLFELKYSISIYCESFTYCKIIAVARLLEEVNKVIKCSSSVLFDKIYNISSDC